MPHVVCRHVARRRPPRRPTRWRAPRGFARTRSRRPRRRRRGSTPRCSSCATPAATTWSARIPPPPPPCPRCLFSSRAALRSLQAPSVRRMRQRTHACLASVQDMRMRLESVMFRLGHRSQTDGAWQRELEMVKGVMHQARAATRRGLVASGTGLRTGRVQVGADPQACPAPEHCRVPRGRVPCADAAGG